MHLTLFLSILELQRQAEIQRQEEVRKQQLEEARRQEMLKRQQEEQRRKEELIRQQQIEQQRLRQKAEEERKRQELLKQQEEQRRQAALQEQKRKVPLIYFKFLIRRHSSVACTRPLYAGLGSNWVTVTESYKVTAIFVTVTGTKLLR